MASFPKGWDPLPQLPQIRTQEMGSKLALIQTNNSTYQEKMPLEYRSRVALRVTLFVVMIIAITVAILALNQQLTTFPQDFVKWFQNINWVHVELAAIPLVALTGGAVAIIANLKYKQDPLSNQDSGKFSGEDYWESAYYASKKHGLYPGYIDKSTLDEAGNGLAYMYGVKGEQDHYAVSLVVGAFTPVHMVGAIAYNILRLFVIPFYILAAKDLKAKEIVVEWKNSLFRIVKAPFYATAIIFSCLYSFFDPLNGRKLGSYIERDWNEDVSRAEGFWSVRGPQSLWKFEGGGASGELGKNGFYLAGCWQPIAIVHYQNGKIVSGESLSHAIEEEKGELYEIFDAQNSLEIHQRALADLNGLIIA